MISRTGTLETECYYSSRLEFTVIGYLVGASAVIFMVVLAYGAITGRVKLDNGCCCPSDPRSDLRMRD